MASSLPFTLDDFYQSLWKNMVKCNKRPFLALLNRIYLKHLKQDCQSVKNDVPKLLLLIAKKFGHHEIESSESEVDDDQKTNHLQLEDFSSLGEASLQNLMKKFQNLNCD